MVDLAYYPGCSLHGTSEEYDSSIRAVCNELNLGLQELEDWTCCGASSAHVLDDQLARLLAVRNLALAGRVGKDLLVPCAACYSRLKFAEKEISDDPTKWANGPADSSMVNIVHLHDLLGQKEIKAAIAGKITRPLTGLKVIPYYGCLTVRPPKVVGSSNPENPTTLDRITETLGAQVVPWSFKTDCCGGSFSVSRPEVVRKLSGDLMEAAKYAGGNCFVTDCPMCQANLDTRQEEIEQERGTTYKMPIFFITELIALAMGLSETKTWLKKHLVDPLPLLVKTGLI